MHASAPATSPFLDAWAGPRIDGGATCAGTDRASRRGMTPLRIIALVLIVLGLVVLLWGGLFWKDRDTVFHAGGVEVTTEHEKGVSVPPILGGAAIVVGVILLLIPQRSRA
jgi:uncharacterized iron-regulated membrane protein